MNFSDKLNNLQNNNGQNYNMDFDVQNTFNYNENSSYIDYTQEQPFNNPNAQINNEEYAYSNDPKNNSPYNNPNSQWMQQNQQNVYHGTGGYNPYNQQHSYPSFPYNQPQGQGQPHNQPYNQSYGQIPPQQPFHSPHGYGYEETNFESRNIIRNMNQYNNTNNDVSTKRLGKRFLAFILDGIFFNIPSSLLALLFVVPSFKKVIETVLYMEEDFAYAVDMLAGKITALSIINLIVFIAYYIIVPAYVLQGRTLGKKLMKLRIATIEGDEVPDVVTLIKRELLGKLLSSFFLIGYFMILFTKNHSGLHDKIAKTKVIDDDGIY
jgi:uncharacterized RDD family membrane protein YckC